MRKIKFRAWEKNLEEMIKVDDIQFRDDEVKYMDWIKMIPKKEQPIMINTKTAWRTVWEDVELMQYTWLKDKNWKEIYEWDIVKWSDWEWEWTWNPRIAKVEFNPELSFFAINVNKKEWWHKFWFSNFIYSNTEKHLEIIWNIYENSELLS